MTNSTTLQLAKELIEEMTGPVAWAIGHCYGIKELRWVTRFEEVQNTMVLLREHIRVEEDTEIQRLETEIQQLSNQLDDANRRLANAGLQLSR